MTKTEMVALLNEIIRHERRHFNFYLQCLMVIEGYPRVWLSPLLEKEMNGELGHIRLFGDKVVAYGGEPTTECHPYRAFVDAKDILEAAISMEREVLQVYHDAYAQAEQFAAEHGDMSVVLLLEENIEDTTTDVEELEKIRGSIVRC